MADGDRIANLLVVGIDSSAVTTGMVNHLLTVVIRPFLPLSAASYRSMAKMKVVTPC